METIDKMTKTVLKTDLTIIVVKTMTDVDYNTMMKMRIVNMRTSTLLKAKTLKAVMKMNNMKIVKMMTMADAENNKDNGEDAGTEDNNQDKEMRKLDTTNGLMSSIMETVTIRRGQWRRYRKMVIKIR